MALPAIGITSAKFQRPEFVNSIILCQKGTASLSPVPWSYGPEDKWQNNVINARNTESEIVRLLHQL